MYAGRTVLFISHRFNTVRVADHIYVLHHGRIVEHGDHDTLIARGGLYAELFTLQAAAYTTNPAATPLDSAI
jgi:ATP-binding cassette subfamily B protein